MFNFFAFKDNLIFINRNKLFIQDEKALRVINDVLKYCTKPITLFSKIFIKNNTNFKMDEIENDFHLFVLKFNFEVAVKSTSFVILLTSVQGNEN